MILPFLLFLLLVTQAYTEEDHATLETNKSEVVYFHLHINLLFNSVILNPFKSSKRIGNWKYNGGWGSSCFRIALGPGLFSTNGVVLRGIARYYVYLQFFILSKISCFGEKNVRINSFLQLYNFCSYNNVKCSAFEIPQTESSCHLSATYDWYELLNKIL